MMNSYKYLWFSLLLLAVSCEDQGSEILDTFQIEEGFKMELVASEPFIKDPVDLEFDANGNAFVLEMPGYPYEESQSRVVALFDDNDDKVFDRSKVYAENLQLASSIMPFKDGLLVAAPPFLLYVADNDNDYSVDQIDTLMGGFSTGNLQHNYNGLTFGIDGWIYAANGGNSGNPFWWGEPESEIDLRGQDLRIHIDQRKIERIGRSSGGFELAIDEYGRIFETHNLEHISQLVFPGRYLENVRLNIDHTLNNISDHEEGGLSRIYPIGEQETRVNHPEQSGYFSGSCGTTYYGGNALGEEYDQTVWVADCVLNLIHVDKISSEGAGFKAARTVEKRDFIASTDRSSRPVNMTVGPDGSMYIIDMYRDVIEHPEWIPDDIEATLDLNAGKDKGRIFRVSPDSKKLDQFDGDIFNEFRSLVSALSSPNQWVRNTAHRLIIEMDINEEQLLALKKSATSDNDFQRLHTLWILNTKNALDNNMLIAAMGDNDHGIRENVLIMAESRFTDSTEIPNNCINLLIDDHHRVRMQAALTLSTLKDEVARKYEEDLLPGLVNASTLPMDQWNIAAVTIAASRFPHRLFSLLIKSEGMDNALLTSLARQSTHKNVWIESILNDLVKDESNTSLQSDIITSMATEDLALKSTGNIVAALRKIESSGNIEVLTASTALRQKLGLPPSPSFIAVSKKALDNVSNKNLTENARLEYLALAALLPYEVKSQTLYSCLDNTEPIGIQEAAIQQLWQAQNPEIGEKLVAIWKGLGPNARKKASDVLLYKKSHHDALLSGLEEGIINIGEMNFDLERRRTLLWWTDDENTKRRAEALFSDSGVVNRKEALDKMRPAIALAGNLENGKTVYTNLCSQCHVYGDIGVSVGPVLTEINRKSKESLMHDIVDPNAAVDTRYINHRVETNDGVIHVGMVDQETDTELTIKQIGGTTVTISKSDVKAFSSLGTSLMMEGLESGLSTQDMADLLEYLTKTN